MALNEYNMQFVPSNEKDKHCDCARHCCAHAPVLGAVLPAALISKIVPAALISLWPHTEFADGCNEGVQPLSVGGRGAAPEQPKQVLS